MKASGAFLPGRVKAADHTPEPPARHHTPPWPPTPFPSSAGGQWTLPSLTPPFPPRTIAPRKWTTCLRFSASPAVLLGTYDIVPGDARIELTKAPDRGYDVIVLDAFSSDFVPMHLLTREAAQLYARKLRSRGTLVYHISTRYLNLAPMVAKLAEEMGMVCFSRMDRSLDQAALDASKAPAHYLAVAPPGVLPESITQRSTWLQVTPPPAMMPWRDDCSNILAVLRRQRPRPSRQAPVR